MEYRRICVLGGTGFVGRALAQTLAARGVAVRVVTRQRDTQAIFPSECAVEVVHGNVHYVSDLTEHFKDCDAVVNLVGILNETPTQTFAEVHAELPQKVAEACQYAKIGRLLHMSALGVGHDAPSRYLKTKAAGEDAAKAACEHLTVFRPSVIFGAQDNFTNQFATLLRYMPFVFPLAAGRATMTPVFIDDVVAAFADALNDPNTFGQHYDIVGPTTYTLADIVRLIARTAGIRRYVLELGSALSTAQALVLERVPGKPLTRDNLLSLSVPGVTDENGLLALGIEPQSMEAILPSYLG